MTGEDADDKNQQKEPNQLSQVACSKSEKPLIVGTQETVSTQMVVETTCTSSLSKESDTKPVVAQEAQDIEIFYPFDITSVFAASDVLLITDSQVSTNISNYSRFFDLYSQSSIDPTSKEKNRNPFVAIYCTEVLSDSFLSLLIPFGYTYLCTHLLPSTTGVSYLVFFTLVDRSHAVDSFASLEPVLDAADLPLSDILLHYGFSTPLFITTTDDSVCFSRDHITYVPLVSASERSLLVRSLFSRPGGNGDFINQQKEQTEDKLIDAFELDIELGDIKEILENLGIQDPLIIDTNPDEDELQALETGYADNAEPLTEEQQVEIREKVKKILSKELEKIEHLTSHQKDQLKEVVLANIDAFATEQSDCRMSSLTPIRATLKTGHPPISEKARSMSFEKLEFLRGKLEDLIKIGMIEQEPNPRFGSPVFVVPKKGPKRFRMVVDLRLLNKYSELTPLDLPNLENQLLHLQKSKHYASFDVISGFDFLRVEKSSQEIFVITTPFGAFRMKGAPMGWCNTPQLFQARIVQEILHPIGLFCKLSRGILQWIDDSLIYSDSFDELLDMMKKFLRQVQVMGVRLKIKKCVLYTKEAEFCGRIVSNGTWKFLPKYFNSCMNMKKPDKLHQLMEVVYIAQWLSGAVPGFARVRDKLTHSLEQHGLTKRALKEANIDIDWTEERSSAWLEFKELLLECSQKALCNYNHSKELALFTDASNKYWSAVVAQITPLSDHETPDYNNLEVEPLLFLSGKFTSSQKRWHISQQELYPIVHVFHRVSFLLQNPSKTINIFTDHNSLRYLLDPTLTKNKNHQERLSRRALTIQQVRTRVFHIPATHNVLADVLSRWGYQSTRPQKEPKTPKEADFQPKESVPLSSEEVNSILLQVEAQEKENKFWEDDIEIVLVAFRPEIGKNHTKENIQVTPLSTNEVEVTVDAIRTQEQREELESFNRQFAKALKKDDISFFHPFYEGKFSLLCQERILQYQKDSSICKENALEPKKDRSGRVILPKEALTHLIVANHIQYRSKTSLPKAHIASFIAF